MTIALPALSFLTPVKPLPIDFGSDLQPALGGPRQYIARLGARHAIEVDLPTLDAASFAVWNAALKKSRATGVELVLGWPQPLPAAGLGSPLVNGAGQAGTSLAVRGFSASASIGQIFFTMISGGRLYLHSVTDAATANGAGAATLSIEPRLRVVPADGDVLNFVAPSIQGFADGTPKSWEDKYRKWQTLSFTLTESA